MSNILYKYINIRGGYNMITNQDLQFTSALNLNDPFDCHPKLIDYSNVPDTRLQGWIPKNWWIDKEENDAFNLRNEAYLCSLSTVNDSLLMWSHYCYNHKGICIGLNIDKVMESIPPLFCEMYTQPLIVNVQYQDIIQRPDAYEGKVNKLYYQLGTKAKDWEYEHEVRLVALNPSFKYFRFTEEQVKLYKENPEIIWHYQDRHFYLPLKFDCFDSIFLGVNIEQGFKEDIIHLARTNLNPQIKLYQMVIDASAFKLRPVVI